MTGLSPIGQEADVGKKFVIRGIESHYDRNPSSITISLVADCLDLEMVSPRTSKSTWMRLNRDQAYELGNAISRLLLVLEEADERDSESPTTSTAGR